MDELEFVRGLKVPIESHWSDLPEATTTTNSQLGRNPGDAGLEMEKSLRNGANFTHFQRYIEVEGTPAWPIWMGTGSRKMALWVLGVRLGTWKFSEVHESDRLRVRPLNLSRVKSLTSEATLARPSRMGSGSRS